MENKPFNQKTERLIKNRHFILKRDVSLKNGRLGSNRSFSQNGNLHNQFKQNHFKHCMHVHKITFNKHLAHRSINQNIHFIRARHATFYHIIIQNS